MTELLFCAWVDGETECELMATFVLHMHGGNAGYDGKHLESCGQHLADLARNLADVYAVDSVTIEDLR